MAVALMEVQRARRAIDAFCEKRNQGMRKSAKSLRCQQDGDYLLLVETCAPGELPGNEAINPLVRLKYQDRHWLLFCPDGSGNWAPYPLLPCADSIAIVLDELEQAPLHVHW